jgi:hypothetical protein
MKTSLLLLLLLAACGGGGDLDCVRNEPEASLREQPQWVEKCNAER